MCEPGRAVGAGAVYYLLPLDTDTRAPILTAAVRLPGVPASLKAIVGVLFPQEMFTAISRAAALPVCLQYPVF